jgi:hypothetical protein
MSSSEFVPIVLLLTMVGVASYLFAGQFATYVGLSICSPHRSTSAHRTMLWQRNCSLDLRPRLQAGTTGEAVPPWRNSPRPC